MDWNQQQQRGSSFNQQGGSGGGYYGNQPSGGQQNMNQGQGGQSRFPQKAQQPQSSFSGAPMSQGTQNPQGSFQNPNYQRQQSYDSNYQGFGNQPSQQSFSQQQQQQGNAFPFNNDNNNNMGGMQQYGGYNQPSGGSQQQQRPQALQQTNAAQNQLLELARALQQQQVPQGQGQGQLQNQSQSGFSSRQPGISSQQPQDFSQQNLQKLQQQLQAMQPPANPLQQLLQNAGININQSKVKPDIGQGMQGNQLGSGLGYNSIGGMNQGNMAGGGGMLGTNIQGGMGGMPLSQGMNTGGQVGAQMSSQGVGMMRGQMGGRGGGGMGGDTMSTRGGPGGMGGGRGGAGGRGGSTSGSNYGRGGSMYGQGGSQGSQGGPGGWGDSRQGQTQGGYRGGTQADSRGMGLPTSGFGGMGSMGRGGGGRDSSNSGRGRIDRFDRSDRGSDRGARAPPRDNRDRDRDRDRDRRDRDRDNRPRDRDHKVDHKDVHEKSSSARKDDRPPERDREKGKDIDRSKEKERDVAHTSRRREKSVSVERDREKKYTVKVSNHCYCHYEYDYSLLKRLFTRLCISPDFTRVVASWVNTVPVSNPLPIIHPLQIVCESKELPAATPVEVSPGSSLSVKYNAKVILMSSYPHEDIATVTESQVHLSKTLKFLVSKERDGIVCIGGTSNPEVDGDPAHDQDALLHTARRVVLEQTQIDLSAVNSWVRFMEVWYHRESGQEEVTVIFIPDISEIAPTFEQFLAQWHLRQPAKQEGVVTPESSDNNTSDTSAVVPKTETAEKDPHDNKEEKDGTNSQDKTDDNTDKDSAGSKEKEEPNKEKKLEEVPKEALPAKEKEPPQEPCFYATSSVDKNSKKKLMMISLDGLLDYDETDKLEATFELSLFGELFHYMLQRDFGYVIYQALHDAKEKDKDKDKDKKVAKRARDDTAADMGTSKKLKAEEPVKTAESVKAEELVKVEQPVKAEGVVKAEEFVEKPVTPVEPTAPATEENKETEPMDEGTLKIDEPVVTEKKEEQPNGEEQGAKAETTKMEITKTENEEEPVVTTRRVTDESVLAAFRYFDRTAIGYIRDDDLELIVHNLGLFQCKRVVHNLVAAVGTEYSAKSCRVYYERIAEKEVPIDDNVNE